MLQSRVAKCTTIVNIEWITLERQAIWWRSLKNVTNMTGHPNRRKQLLSWAKIFHFWLSNFSLSCLPLIWPSTSRGRSPECSRAAIDTVGSEQHANQWAKYKTTYFHSLPCTSQNNGKPAAFYFLLPLCQNWTSVTEAAHSIRKLLFASF